MSQAKKETLKLTAVVGLIALMGGLLWRGVQIQIGETVDALKVVAADSAELQITVATIQGSRWSGDQQRGHEHEVYERMMLLLEAVHQNQLAMVRNEQKIEALGGPE